VPGHFVSPADFQITYQAGVSGSLGKLVVCEFRRMVKDSINVSPWLPKADSRQVQGTFMAGNARLVRARDVRAAFAAPPSASIKEMRQAVAPKSQSFCSCDGTANSVWHPFRSYISFLLNRADGYFISSYFRNPVTAERKCRRAFTGGIVMIFDIVSVAILFQTIRVLSRLIGQRHGDVLDYVARQKSTLVSGS
jgi:hypothetical protein